MNGCAQPTDLPDGPADLIDRSINHVDKEGADQKIPVELLSTLRPNMQGAFATVSHRATNSIFLLGDSYIDAVNDAPCSVYVATTGTQHAIANSQLIE